MMQKIKKIKKTWTRPANIYILLLWLRTDLKKDDATVQKVYQERSLRHFATICLISQIGIHFPEPQNVQQLWLSSRGPWTWSFFLNGAGGDY